MFILLAALAAFIYPFGSLWYKQAQVAGAGVWRSTIISNWMMSLCFLVLPVLPGMRWEVDWSLIAWPILAGLTYLLGQLFTVFAVQAGDVSVQAPLMGTKVILVALYSVFILGSEQLDWTIWLAAGITTAAVFLLGGTGTSAWRAQRKAVLYAILSCVFFAATDSIVGGRGKAFGSAPMLVGVMTTLSIASLLCWPLARREPIAPRSRPFIMYGGIAFGVQALLLGLALSFYGRATTTNIIYSLRGFFGIALVWFIGHWFANRERAEVPRSVMIQRLAGALLLLGAIVMAVV